MEQVRNPRVYRRYIYQQGEVCVCVRACMCACVRACACVRVCVRVFLFHVACHVMSCCPQIAEANDGNPNEMFLFHGSPFVKNIVESGFDERHSCATGMFGAGWCIQYAFVCGCV